MSYGTALVIIAVGAVMRYAVHARADGFSIHTAGTILMVVGAVGLVLSLAVTAAAFRDRRRGPDVDAVRPRRRRRP